MLLNVFMYHRVTPDGGKDALSRDYFVRTLDHLQKHYRILSPDEALDFIKGIRKPAGRKDAALLTFDDGWADNHFYAENELKKRGLCAMIAISSQFFYRGTVRETLDPEIMARSMKEAREAAEEGDFSSFASLNELSVMASSGIWDLQPHGSEHRISGGMSHIAAPFAGESAGDFRKRLAKSIQKNCREVTALTSRDCRVFFWPWGHYSDLAAEVCARECALPLQFTVRKGFIRYGAGKEGTAVLPRIGVSPKYAKFVRNAFIARHPLLQRLHDCFKTVKVYFKEYNWS